jgi:hypothetical protein
LGKSARTVLGLSCGVGCFAVFCARCCIHVSDAREQQGASRPAGNLRRLDPNPVAAQPLRRAGAVHETGHALYEQGRNLNKEWKDLPVNSVGRRV